ncbi:MAG: hypothetical protein KatS3mg054_0020 [Chloroflexus sp.]|nr:MAG: hypothetical protein KatS3mg054_0020 [Chloroflexus sp.]
MPTISSISEEMLSQVPVCQSVEKPLSSELFSSMASGFSMVCYKGLRHYAPLPVWSLNFTGNRAYTPDGKKIYMTTKGISATVCGVINESSTYDLRLSSPSATKADVDLVNARAELNMTAKTSVLSISDSLCHIHSCCTLKHNSQQLGIVRSCVHMYMYDAAVDLQCTESIVVKHIYPDHGHMSIQAVDSLLILIPEVSVDAYTDECRVKYLKRCLPDHLCIRNTLLAIPWVLPSELQILQSWALRKGLYFAFHDNRVVQRSVRRVNYTLVNRAKAIPSHVVYVSDNLDRICSVMFCGISVADSELNSGR